jgi:hypothetical protein
MLVAYRRTSYAEEAYKGRRTTSDHEGTCWGYEGTCWGFLDSQTALPQMDMERIACNLAGPVRRLAWGSHHTHPTELVLGQKGCVATAPQTPSCVMRERGFFCAIPKWFVFLGGALSWAFPRPRTNRPRSHPARVSEDPLPPYQLASHESIAANDARGAILSEAPPGPWGRYSPWLRFRAPRRRCGRRAG